MNCLSCQKLLMRDADQTGTVAERVELEAHLAECSSCRQLQTELGRMSTLIRSESASVPVPNPDTEWRALQSRLHAPASTPRRRAAPVLWWSVPLAAAAAGLLAFILPFSPSRQASTAKHQIASAAPFVMQAEFVEPGDANASTMVYVDKQSGWLVVWATDAAPAPTKSG